MKRSPASSDGTLWSVDYNRDNVYSSHTRTDEHRNLCSWALMGYNGLVEMWRSLQPRSGGGNGGLCLHNMRMRCNKSAGRMVNSAASRCVYARRQVFVWDTRIPAAEPLADPPRTTVTSPNMVHMQAWSSSCGFCQWQPSIPPLLSLSLSLNLL